MIDFKNMTKPLTKLIEVLEKGIGAMARPWLIRRDAKAEANKILTISDTMNQTLGSPFAIEFKDEHLQLSLSEDGSLTPAPLETSVSERAFVRLALREEKRQENIERIASEAAIELENEKNISPDPVDDDWVARFFRIAEDVSSEQMQDVWGRILAGEVKQPGTYSLQTLDTIRNISQSESILFEKLARFRIDANSERLFVVTGKKDQLLEKHVDLQFVDLLLLEELNLISTSTPLKVTLTIDIGQRIVLRICQSALLIDSRRRHALTISAIPFTRTGVEISQLIEPADSDEYLQDVAGLLAHDGVTFQTGKIVSKNGNKYELIDVEELRID